MPEVRNAPQPITTAPVPWTSIHDGKAITRDVRFTLRSVTRSDSETPRVRQGLWQSFKSLLSRTIVPALPDCMRLTGVRRYRF